MRQKGTVAISSGSRSRLVDGELSSVAGLDINFQCCCDRFGIAAGDALIERVGAGWMLLSALDRVCCKKWGDRGQYDIRLIPSHGGDHRP